MFRLCTPTRLRVALVSLLFLAVGSVAVHAQRARPAAGLELTDGDRIALVGGTFIERSQQHGYFELALQIANPDKKLSFRNLGWSGDEATAISRARFGNQQEGYNHLINSVDLVKPTVILVCYGTNEAFQGEAGLEEFLANYKKLLDDLQKRSERIVLITPPKMEKHPAPLPDPSDYNANVDLYCQAIKQLAYDRGYRAVDLTALTDPKAERAENQLPELLTSNGQHFTPTGYWYLGKQMAEQLGFRVEQQRLIGANSQQPVTWNLPYAKSPLAKQSNTIPLRIAGLPEGNHTVRFQGSEPVTASAYQWDGYVEIPAKGQTEKVQQLREAILRKNQLFFDRYRPQNETYLYLFRKHEQGNNAVEIPQFDPLIEEQDGKIFELKQKLSVSIEID